MWPALEQPYDIYGEIQRHAPQQRQARFRWVIRVTRVVQQRSGLPAQGRLQPEGANGRGHLLVLFIAKCYIPGMRVISWSTLRAFAAAHPDAQNPLNTWHNLAKKGTYRNFAELKATFASADQVKGHDLVVFNIGGNKYRLIVNVTYAQVTEAGQMLDGIFWIKHVFTHKQYDDWKP
ncbi:mRNA-degrading endonuclease (mRNA interferase) HigB, toxic component of the HigAB toxin-antitoxin module [Deinococcus hopiensis KR-140]|uniref:mRNA-degrading endonuclease (mRNA interferase) HigB, toxic component of the HigAB toxin-antitoxin module n=2 Tax=Deinococcus TaxID=1298 RepID=A0A1W1UWH1_9DEIO|nr:mRNA-degrading endonuclease (mRNA interferase) HigB, toxic component of the HigAB toxin-antitoxin module [Deinococcus hopiensis KR-140]